MPSVKMGDDMNNRLQWLAIILLTTGLIWSIYMQLSNKGHDILKYFEGCRLTAYQDSVGVWTIGYGHTKGVHSGMQITQAEAESMLLEELVEYQGYIDDLVEAPLNQEQFDALVVWVYNLGPTNLRTSTLLKRLNTGNFEDVPNQIKRGDKAGGKQLAGLTKRRAAEAAHFEGKEWVN
jgi:lysozyme